ncbi:WYL domain-containing protein [Chitinophaga horti]|uniref:WYL domain-containing protein n=1 Tax=Chitinophaga horti TaxID=2920382 RepID=A0ABY6IYA7_9BACT|nr:WYL domain-containing protein [Chitinophaga horti]UYQ92374.1 WYL domain-containing protein [Chitinophaga horti]
MSVNKLALIRYKTIDECLRKRHRKWTLDQLMEKVAEVLYEYEGITSGISKRTIQADIQLMRSDKLGYNAPIIVKDKKYYTYEDEQYSITKAPINDSDIDKMKEIVGLLKQLNGFSYFEEMSEMIARLENNLHKSTHHTSYIQFEHNHLLKGIAHITQLHQAILGKQVLLVEYKSFRASHPQHLIVYPYLLKEYRNRWFLIGRIKGNQSLATLALDRIISFQDLPREAYVSHDGAPLDTYYNDVLGVTKTEKDKAQNVTIKVDDQQAPYVKTKPLHHSQVVVKEDARHLVIQLTVVINFELERELLGFGECVQVLAPRSLAQRIKRRLSAAAAQYVPDSKPE